ncbi:MAG: hypothetical protein AB1346_10575 [Thermodesulfobacteriota bacterium]
MRKGWIVLLAAVLVVAFAAPAMADLKVTGFYRAKAMLSSFFDGSGGPSIRTDAAEQTNAYVEHRARIKFDVGTEVARAVFHFESDMTWGEGAAQNGARNGGGALSADSIQLETKEVYVFFKIPDTSVTAKVGMQSVNDHYAGIFSNAADMAGIFLGGQFEPVKWTFGWAKLFENNAGGASGGFEQDDDVDLYIASAKFAPAKDMDLGVNLYFLKDNSGREGGAKLDPVQGLGSDIGFTAPLNGFKVKVYTPGVNFAMNAGPAKLSAFAFYQFGTADSVVPGVQDVDIKAYLADIRADLKLGPGKFFVEGLYVSGGDGSDATKYESPITLGDYQIAGTNTGGNSGFGRTNMYFLFGADSVNISQCLIGCSGGELGDSLGNSGRGLWHIAAGYSQDFTSKLRGAVNVGMLQAVDTYKTAANNVDTAAAGAIRADRKKDIGTEFNARVDYLIGKGLDVSLVGAYLMLGDFVQNDAGELEFKDSYYMGYARLNYSF